MTQKRCVAEKFNNEISGKPAASMDHHPESPIDDRGSDTSKSRSSGGNIRRAGRLGGGGGRRHLGLPRRSRWPRRPPPAGGGPPPIFRARLAKALGIRRHGAPFFPLDGISLSKRPATMSYAHDSQRMAIRSQQRGNDRYPLAGLGKREQGVRRAALEHNIGLDVRETASCVEQSANRITRVQQQ